MPAQQSSNAVTLPDSYSTLLFAKHQPLVVWGLLRRFALHGVAVNTSASSVSDTTSTTRLLDCVRFERLMELECYMLGGIGGWAGEAALNC